MKPEQRFWSRLSSVLPKGHWVRVENLCESGTPDVSFGVFDTEGWMELKYCACFPMDDEHGVRTTQKLWIKRRLRSARSSIVLIVVGTRTRESSSIVFFVHGRAAETVNHWKLDDFFRRSLSSASLSRPTQVEKALRVALAAFAG